MTRPSLLRMRKDELAAEVERLEQVNSVVTAVIDKELTFRDLEAKMRDGALNVRAVLGEGSQPVSKFLAALMLHFLLGEGDDEPSEPPNYLSGEFSLVPAGGFERITAVMEVVKPGGESSHKIRERLEAENKRLRQRLAKYGDIEGE